MQYFNSEIELGPLLKCADTNLVKNEPMLFSCDIPTALKLGGPITKTFVFSLLADQPHLYDANVIIDSRVHMLMKGWYPCIPGFHHDDVPRLRSDGQPFYPSMEGETNTGYYFAEHALALVGDDICRTQFALGDAEFSDIKHGEVCYKKWHPEVVEHLRTEKLKSYSCPMNQIVYFDARSWHQGVPSTGNGWRWFGRASWDTKRKPTNELRRQVQVYLEFPMEGW